MIIISISQALGVFIVGWLLPIVMFNGINGRAVTAKTLMACSAGIVLIVWRYFFNV